MKKLAVFYLALFTILSFSSCPGNNEFPAQLITVERFALARPNTSESNGNVITLLANDAAIEAAFTLDYRPQRAEGENEAGFLTAADLAGAAAQDSGRGTVFGGGLRRLSDYRTVYFNPAEERSRIAAIRAAQEAGRAGQLQNGETGPLTVIDWGPRGEFSSAVQRPSIHVIFSQPMVPLASLGEQSSSSPLVSIYPPLRGSFRWYGTGFLSFAGDEPCQSQQTYTITVAENATSIHGTRISGERVFTFHTEALSIRSISPGEEFRRRTGFRFNNQNVPPEAARQIGIEFNYPIEADHIIQHLEITGGNLLLRFNLQQETEYRVIANLLDPVGFETQVNIILKRGARSRGGTRGTESDRIFSFNTPGAFVVNQHLSIPSQGRARNLFRLDFSHALNESTVLEALSTVPPIPIGPENIEVWGNRVNIFNLPVDFGSRFTLLVATSVEDIYGRRLSRPYSAAITVPAEPPPLGEAQFLGWGHAMLEAQFPPRFLFEYRNIAPNSFYRLGTSSNPWADQAPIARFDLPPANVNERYFEEIDLSPYLNPQGRGFVSFRANLHLLTNERQRDGTFAPGTWELRNELDIQVTDLGLTVRLGFNRAVVLVTSLSTGLPVEGARVRLLPSGEVREGRDLSDITAFAETLTNRNGLAVMPMGASVLRNNTENASTWWGFDEPFIMAEKNGDKAIFIPNSHSSWRFGISADQPQNAEVITALTFMFSDRGLYRPGETLSFRGVDRSRVLGMYTIYQGDYTISLEEEAYRPQQIVSIQGTTTESGSFYGTINIPDDLQPGSYRLVYRRNVSLNMENDITANVPVTVAFFERLRFQAALSTPAAPVISGDDINLNLRASYLAGGSLAGASWESAWFEQMSVFAPRRAETRGFIFGPRRVWDSQRYIASESGQLSGQGTASLSQRTGGGGRVSGAPYLYQVEARVTDIGNQMISAYRSVQVHPASFYIGIHRGGGGFARAGQEASYDFITVNTLGERTSGSALFLQSGENAGMLTVELIREEWRRIQQRGVGGFIYDEFSPQLIVESTQRIPIGNGSGSIRVRPTSAGFHILRVSAQDREGRTALTELNFHVTGSGAGFWNMASSDEIRLTPDQEMYEPGDTAQILLQSPLPEGRYLITVEREGIFTEEVRHFTEPVTVLEIPIARNFVPVVYVSVSSYSIRSGPPSHVYGSPDLDKPRGYFGVTRLSVNPRSRAFSIRIESDKQTYRPGEEVTMTLIATRDGRPLPGAELSLMAVDRGVLDLINYRVPDPISHFYAEYRFPLSVMGGDSRSWLMDPVTYDVKSLAGGDADGESKFEERRDFNPTAVFEPMLITDANGRVTVTFRLPDNLTTYRVTVFGVRGDLFALRESEIAAQNRINVRELLPRRLRERDTAELGVLITNLDTSPHTLTVRLDIGPPGPDDYSGGLSKFPGQAFVDGTHERRITVRSGENAVVYFDVGALREGTVSLNFTITSNILNERLIRELLIERPFVMESVTTTGTLTTERGSEGLVIPSFADGGMGKLSLILDATRLGLLDSAISYLFHNPFTSLEQRAAAVLPLVIFGEHIDALNLGSVVSNPQRTVETELRSWAQIQLANGGFPFWPSGTTADFYVSLRIAHIIAIAQSKNINIPSSLNIPALRTYLDREYQETQRWRRDSASYYYQSYLQSYMLYVLTLLGERVDPARLNEILSRDNVDPSVLAFTGLTYRALGRNAEAAATAQRLRNLVRLTARGVDITDPLDRQRRNFFGGRIEQMALTLQFFVDQFPGDEINTRLLFSLLENKRSNWGFWQNTAVTARVLTAVDALIRAENLSNLDLSAEVTLAGTELLRGIFRGLGARPVTGTFDFNDPVLAGITRDRMFALEFSRRGTGTLYYTASLSYAIPAELQSFRDEGLGVFLSIHDIETGEEIQGSALVSGRTYRGRVRMSSSHDRTYVALRVPIPSGAEILDATFISTAAFGDRGGVTGNENDRGSSWLSHQLILDNEIQFFWDHFNRGESTVSFLFRAVRRGVYPTPPVQAECMYEPEIFGRSQGVIYTIE
jgi:hypothetical protein